MVSVRKISVRVFVLASLCSIERNGSDLDRKSALIRFLQENDSSTVMAGWLDAPGLNAPILDGGAVKLAAILLLTFVSRLF